MKINSFAILGLLSLVSGSAVRRGNRFGAYDDDEPLDQRSRVTAFVNTDQGLKVQCWEIVDLLPEAQVARADGSKGRFSQTKMGGLFVGITLFTFAPSVTIFAFGASGVHSSSAVDFRAKPNLFTLKGGLISITAKPVSGGDVTTREDGFDQYTFADLNGDDWFYFEDDTTQPSSSSSSSSPEQCAKSMAANNFNVRTVSGSDTTLINFEYESTPRHRVLHEGRCNFAGLTPVSPSSWSDPDSGKSHLRSQEL